MELRKVVAPAMGIKLYSRTRQKSVPDLKTFPTRGRFTGSPETID